jgi:hypothetical protein
MIVVATEATEMRCYAGSLVSTLCDSLVIDPCLAQISTPTPCETIHIAFQQCSVISPISCSQDRFDWLTVVFSFIVTNVPTP